MDNLNHFSFLSNELPPEGLKLISTCPLCHTQYTPTMAKILGERDGAHLLHLTCRKCSSLIVALVMTGGMGVSSVGLITDLTSDDVVKFKDAGTVQTDDVIEVHELLERDGALQRLLKTAEETPLA